MNAKDAASGAIPYCIGITVFLTALTFSFQVTSFFHAKEAVFLAGLLVLGFLSLGIPPSGGFRVLWPCWAALALAMALSFVDAPCLWPMMIPEAARWAGLLLFASLVCGHCRDESVRRAIPNALVLSAVAAGLLGLAQYAGTLTALFPRFENYNQPVYSVFGNQDLFGGYLALALPILVWSLYNAPRGRLLVFAATVVLGVAIVLSQSRSAWLAAAVGVAVAVPMRRAQWVRARLPLFALAALVLAGLACAWPVLSSRVLETWSPSDTGGRARLWFWSGAWRMVLDHPWIGAGLGAFRHWSPRYLGEALCAPGGETLYHNEVHTLYAHCDPLEFLAEIGPFPLILAALILPRLFHAGHRGAAGALLSLFVFSLLNPAMHSPPHAFAALLLVALLASRRLPPPRQSRLSWIALPAVLVLGVFHTGAVLIPSHLLRAAEDAHLAGADAAPLYRRVIAYPWPNPEAHEEYAMLLIEEDRPQEALGQLEQARALGLDTGRVYLLEARAAEALPGHRAEAFKAAKACLERWPDHPEAWGILKSAAPGPFKRDWADYAKRWNLPLD